MAQKARSLLDQGMTSAHTHVEELSQSGKRWLHWHAKSSLGAWKSCVRELGPFPGRLLKRLLSLRIRLAANSQEKDVNSELKCDFRQSGKCKETLGLSFAVANIPFSSLKSNSVTFTWYLPHCIKTLLLESNCRTCLLTFIGEQWVQASLLVSSAQASSSLTPSSTPLVRLRYQSPVQSEHY